VTCATCQAIEAAVAAGNEVPLLHELRRQLAAARDTARPDPHAGEVAALRARLVHVEELARRALVRVREMEEANP
jgi:hypothetical protein